MTTTRRTLLTTTLAVALLAPVAAAPAFAYEPGHVEVEVDGDVVLAPPAPTLAESLDAAGIEVKEFDEVSQSLANPAVPGGRLVIDRGQRQMLVEEGILHHSTVEEEDPSLPRGEKEVRTEGKDGLMRSVFVVVTVGDQETERDHLISVTVPPVDEVVAVGTKDPEPEPAPEPVREQAPAQATSRPTPKQQPAPQPPRPAVSSSASHSPAGNQQIAASMVAGRGWGQDQFQCLVTLWNRESNWNHTAQNPSSGAYGIPQSLPADKMATHGADWRTNPATQIAWGLDYISGRYGTPCSALDHSYARGWY